MFYIFFHPILKCYCMQNEYSLFSLELNETVICTNDQMQVIIPSVFFLNKEPPVYVCPFHLFHKWFNKLQCLIFFAVLCHFSLIFIQVWDLHLNDPDCRGVEVGNDYVFSIKTNLTDCGTIMVILISIVKALCVIIKPLQMITRTGEWPPADYKGH